MELRKAEMEARKAENMVEHEAEINARPARTWFQTKKEKAAVSERSATTYKPPAQKSLALAVLKKVEHAQVV